MVKNNKIYKNQGIRVVELWYRIKKNKVIRLIGEIQKRFSIKSKLLDNYGIKILIRKKVSGRHKKRGDSDIP